MTLEYYRVSTEPPPGEGGGGSDTHPQGLQHVEHDAWCRGECWPDVVRLIPSSIASWLSILLLHEHHHQPDRYEASIQVTWSRSTNPRPVWEWAAGPGPGTLIGPSGLGATSSTNHRPRYTATHSGRSQGGRLEAVGWARVHSPAHTK